MKVTDPYKDLRYVVFYDGVCNLCSHIVRFFLKLDKQKKFKYIALQSPLGKEILQSFGNPESNVDSVILLKNNQVYYKSKAIFELVREAGGGVRFLLFFRIFPDRFNDYLYDIVARNRYNIFGKKQECFIIE